MPENMNIRNVAALAKIALNPEEEARLAPEMERILVFARQLQAIGVDGVPPTQHVLPLCNVFRADDGQPCLSRDAILSAAPAREENCIAVPRTVEEVQP